ncbi:vWA domain-containing protein [Vibrio tasmaniensis]|uniref:vWA domain-containing protein n=1 Tax=Vibrio tasmaniensis TaxID=212663 RepID=UPI00111AB103|nr:VWA domain-containing protein [Vibrio tasmaniensis]
MSDFLNSLVLGYPAWFFLLPLPLFVMRRAPPFQTKNTAIKVPFFTSVLCILAVSPNEGANELKPTRWQIRLLLLNWLMLITALAQPVLLGAVQSQQLFARDIMVVTDLSGSMAKTDFTDKNGTNISRLDAAKNVLAEFASQRQGDRLGLILFGDSAFIQTPFTTDQKVWLELLNQTDVGMAGQSTHLGDAIGLTLKAFKESNHKSTAEPKDKVAIILTDGNDTGSHVPPIEAAKMAKQRGITLHVIAMGDPATAGEDAMDMTVIERIAEESGGQAFQALDSEELSQAYQTINELELTEFESQQFQPKQSIHHLFVGIALIVSLCLISLSLWRQRRVR